MLEQRLALKIPTKVEHQLHEIASFVEGGSKAPRQARNTLTAIVGGTSARKKSTLEYFDTSELTKLNELAERLASQGKTQPGRAARPGTFIRVDQETFDHSY